MTSLFYTTQILRVGVGVGVGVGNVTPSSTEHVGELPPPEPNPVLNRVDVAEAFSAARVAAGGGSFVLKYSQQRGAEEIADELNRQPDPRAALATALANFFAAPWTKARGFVWQPDFGADIGRWLVAQPEAAAKPAGPAKAKSIAEMKDARDDFDKLMAGDFG